MQPAKLVRLKWSEFQRWLEPRRRTMERQRDEITNEQDAKWSATVLKSKAKKEAHEANKALFIHALEEKHFGEARAEWQVRLEMARLSDEAWGNMTADEQFAISKALGGDLDEEDEDPIVADVFAIPKQPQSSALAPVPAPILSSASRSSNFSTSSYTLVSPADLGSDDELYAAVSSYIVPTDESDDEVTSIPVPIQNGKGWGADTGWSPWSSSQNSLNGSPDRPDSKSLPESSYNVFQPVEPKAVSKRLFDSDIKPAAKTRVHGPKYIGPQVSDSDETSDEEANFEKFRMVTRITKIVEFHHAAALADIDLALGIFNGRRTKQLRKAEEELKVAQHERRMLELQVTKENERKAIVAAERKKRRDELRSRSILRDPIQAADSANYDALFDPSTFQVDVDVNGAFALRREDASIKTMANHVHGLSSGVPHVPLPETLGVRNQSDGRETPSVSQGKQSAWKMKSAPSALSQVHRVYDDAATPIPERMADGPWSSTSLNPLAHSVSLENGDFHIPGGFPVGSKAKVAPVASGWAKKPSPATASTLGSLKKADEKPIIAVNEVNRMPPPAEPERPASPPIPSSKKPSKKQRQTNKKSGAASSAEVEPSPSPSTAITTSSSKTSISSASTVEQEELSSTPHTNVAYMMMKRQGLVSGGKSTPIIRGDDPASTPRPSALKQLHDPTESTAEEVSPWERMMRKKAPIPDPHGAESFKQETSLNRAAKQKPQVQDHRSIKFSASTSSSVEEEESPWDRMMRLKAQTQAAQASLNTAPQTSGEEEETPWQRAMRLKGQNQVPHSASMFPSNLTEDESPWERAERMKGQSQISRGPSSSSAKSMMMEESESPWEQMARKTSQQGSEKFATTSVRPPTGAPSNSWQSEHPDAYPFDMSAPELLSAKEAPIPMRQEFWHPGGVNATHQVWNPSGRAQPSHLDKSSSLATPSGRPQQMNRVPDPGSPSTRSGYTNLPDIDEFVPTSILKGTKSKNPPKKTKKVTIEEIPDEEGGREFDERLPSNSRYVLDIVEPKPSVPSNMYTRFFDYEAEEDDTESSSMAPTPSTAPTSPPGEVPSLDDDELMDEIKKGDWENLLAGNSSKSTQNTNHARWPTSSFTNEIPTSQAPDSTKLASALQLINDIPSTAENPNVPSKPASFVDPIPDTKENKEPVVKSNKDAKGKGKGKGAGGKGKGGRK